MDGIREGGDYPPSRFLTPPPSCPDPDPRREMNFGKTSTDTRPCMNQIVRRLTGHARYASESRTSCEVW